jgi:hypothetical protein
MLITVYDDSLELTYEHIQVTQGGDWGHLVGRLHVSNNLSPDDLNCMILDYSTNSTDLWP